MARRTYKNPPIDEALCDFVFLPSMEWKTTFVGRFEAEIHNRFSGESREERATGIHVNPTTGEARPLPTQFQRMIFPSADGTALATLRPDRLSVNALRPYIGWEKFGGLVEWTLNKYCEMTKPKGVTRIGVRYINRVDLSSKGEEQITLGDYFALSPALCPFPAAVMTAFRTYSAAEPTEGENPPTVVTSFGDAASMGRPGVERQFVLDIDVFQHWETTKPLPVKEAMAQVDALRDLERDAFEASITDKLREHFDQ